MVIVLVVVLLLVLLICSKHNSKNRFMSLAKEPPAHPHAGNQMLRASCGPEQVNYSGREEVLELVEARGCMCENTKQARDAFDKQS